MVDIKLKKGREESLLRGHPWVFSGAIQSAGGDIEEGDVVDVVAWDGKFLARGISALGSIAVRILSFEKVEIDDLWWQERLSEAFAMRSALGLIQNEDTNCYRLVHGEGDGLGGLVVDVYGSTAVMQAHTVGIYLMRDTIARALVDAVGVKAVYDKSSGTVGGMDGVEDGYLIGGPIDEELREAGLVVKAAWQGGQKTGFFLDQRDNRDLLRRYARGRRVLNTFCYTGGFSLAALAGGALDVVSVDSSQRAIDLCSENIEKNFPQGQHQGQHQEVVADDPEYVRTMEQGAFDLVVLDPPAFAKHRGALNNALQAYKRLNGAAIARSAPGSIIFTFSCSQAVSREQFRLAVFSGAATAKRKVRILHFLSQAPDHPVNIYHPEGEYLKGLVLYVE